MFKKKHLSFWAVVPGLLSALLIGCTGTAPKVASGTFEVDPEWTFETSDQIISSPVVAGDIAVVRTESQVIALDLTTQKPVWTVSSLGTIYDTAPPQIHDDVVLVPEGSNPLAAFNLKDGSLLWRNCRDADTADCADAPRGRYINFMVVDNDNVLISNHYGDIDAYDLQSGLHVWKIDMHTRGGSALATDDSLVFFENIGFGIDQLQAADISSGELRWKQNMNDVLGRLIAKNGILYFTKGLDRSSYVIVGTVDGDVLWYSGFQGASASQLNHLTVDDDAVLVAGKSLNAFRSKDGKSFWVIPNLEEMQQPIVFNGMVLVRGEHILYAVDKQTGREIGQLSLEAAPGRQNVELNPTTYGDLVLIPVGKTTLAAYRLKMLD